MFDSKNTVSDRIKNKIRLERTGSDSKEGSDIKKITSCIKVKKLPAQQLMQQKCNPVCSDKHSFAEKNLDASLFDYICTVYLQCEVGIQQWDEDED